MRAIAPSVHPIRLLRTRRGWSLRTLAGHSGVGFRLLWQLPVGPEKDQKRSALVAQLADVRRELDNLIEGLARTGASPRLTAAIRDREARQVHLEHELDALEQRTLVSEVELQRIEQLARQKVESWRAVMAKRAPSTRQILSKILRERLVFVPERREGRMGYRFTGEANILKLLSGTVPELAAGSGGVPNGTQPTVFRGTARGLELQFRLASPRGNRDRVECRFSGVAA